MDQLTMQAFEQQAKAAIEKEISYMYIELEMDGFSEKEIILNPLANIDKKIDYYKKTYNEYLQHNHAPIKITSYGFIERVGELEDAIKKESLAAYIDRLIEEFEKENGGN